MLLTGTFEERIDQAIAFARAHNIYVYDHEKISGIYRKAGVVLNSGLFFDDKRGKQVHRACLSSPRSMCLEAFARIAKEFE